MSVAYLVIAIARVQAVPLVPFGLETENPALLRSAACDAVLQSSFLTGLHKFHCCQLRFYLWELTQAVARKEQSKPNFPSESI